MSKLTFLKIFSITMLLLNIVLIGMMLRSEKGNFRQKNKGPRDEIIKKLHLDNEQVVAYDKLIIDHRTKIEDAQQQIKKLKNGLYEQLKNDSMIDRNADSMISEINQVQKNIEYIHLHHFQDIGRLCKPSQKEYYGGLTAEIARLFSPHRPPNKQ
ncbi:MAG: hypothetical protein IPO02_08050 [Bacteroidetes bacterium]|jgi:hypothetical protein|nr:hypothetical protein [Bacteroidota bacterium]